MPMLRNQCRNLLLFSLTLAVLTLTGCERFFRRPMQVPPEAAGLPGVAALKGDDLTPAMFGEAFPPIDTFILSTRVQAKYRRILGTTYLEMSMVAAGPKMIRMAGRHPGDRTTVFDMVFNFPNMHVYLPLEAAYYRGPVAPEGSPFGTAFGVEPWDLIPILEIGQRVSYGQFSVAPGGTQTLLWMSDGDLKADGLVSVTLDRSSGLPEQALWRRGTEEYRVEYRAWGIFESIRDAGERHLMPTRLVIHRADPYARIEVKPREELDQYKIEPELSAKTFELIFPRETTFRTLEELRDLLGG